MQSTSLKSAQPAFPGDVAKAIATVLSAIVLVAALGIAFAVVRAPSAPAATVTVQQALVDHRKGEREAYAAPRDAAAAAEQALVEHRKGERESFAGTGDAAVDRALIEHRNGERESFAGTSGSWSGIGRSAQPQ